MGRRLSADQVEFYAREGYLAPFRAIPAAEAAARRTGLDAFEREEGFSAGSIHMKGHLAFRWSWALARNTAILDVVEDLIGPDILVFASKFWIKGGRDGIFVSWHQDSAYFGLEPHALVTAWVALTPSHPANGCVRVMPRSHTGPAFSHRETYHEKNLLARGQTIDGIDETKAVDLVLEAGEFSLHHERIVHGSTANETDDARIGLALFYIPTEVRSTLGRRTAALVRGTDRFGHWDTDPEPARDRDPAILAHMRAAMARYKDRSVAQEAETG
ncbi:MAG: phytanoyl-CoA dioxygenase family protein [Alphaproteobacteria bacterium]|nr:phytanoyl-CoA dioxygenase family protein [Alphaproteobacteria bacterium]